MASVDIRKLEAGEELPNRGDNLVGDVLALGAPDEQRRLLVPGRVGVLERKIAQVAQGLAQDVERHPKLLHRAALGPEEVAQQELPDGHGLVLRGCELLIH